MLPSLLIKYAVDSCTKDQVQEVFEAIFGEAIIKNVVELNRFDSRNGRPYKMFFIYFLRTNEALLEFMKGMDPCQHVLYNDPYYWKVIVAEPRTKEPRVMTKAEIKAQQVSSQA